MDLVHRRSKSREPGIAPTQAQLHCLEIGLQTGPHSETWNPKFFNWEQNWFMSTSGPNRDNVDQTVQLQSTVPVKSSTNPQFTVESVYRLKPKYNNNNIITNTILLLLLLFLFS